MQAENEKRGLSAFDLKCIAVATMLVDHIGANFFPAHLWMRYVGRLSFPIYCFLIAEGYIHTRDVKKYMGRLFVVALLSEVPFDLLWYRKPFYVWHQNVFFTLILGLLCIYGFDHYRALWQRAVILIAAGLFMFFVVRSDYGVAGMLMIFAFYVFRTRILGRFLSVSAVNILLFGGIQCAAVLAFVPIQLYDGRKGPSAKYFFYLVYPLHLLLLYFIGRYLSYVS